MAHLQASPLFRFSTAITDSRHKADKDPAAIDDEGGGARVRLPGAGYYDDSEAKLANRDEDTRLAMAIQGISIERYRTVAEIEDGKKTVKKGFHHILSQQKLLDVARADNAVVPRRRSSGDTPPASCQPSPSGQLSSKNTHQSSSSPRQNLYLSPSSPKFSPNSQDTNRTGRDSDRQRRSLSPHRQDPMVRSYDGFRGSRPLTSGGQRTAGAQQKGWSTKGAESFTRGAGPKSKLYKQNANSSRARTAPSVRQSGSNQYKPVKANHNQHRPVQASSARHNVDTDGTDTDNDDVAIKQTRRKRSNSAFGIGQMHLPSSSDEADASGSVAIQTLPIRQRSYSSTSRPHTAGTTSFHSRSRRELSRLTHIDAITAAKMAIRRKMWLAQQESQNHLGDAVLQQRVQEFITKLDRDKKAMPQPVLLHSKDELTEVHLVLPTV